MWYGRNNKRKYPEINCQIFYRTISKSVIKNYYAFSTKPEYNRIANKDR